MQITLHQTHQSVCDFEGILKYLQDFKWDNSPNVPSLHLFPELFLCGYPLQDLCLQKPFVSKYIQHLEQINSWAKDWAPQGEHTLFLGGLHYELTDSGVPHRITNVIYQLIPGGQLETLYTKRLLPNYDIFDEKKYFDAGSSPSVVELYGKQIGLLICEDMWTSNVHDLDPCLDLHQYCQKENIQLDALVNLSASPYIVNKVQTRIERGQELAKLFDAPFFYVNRVGGEDEILFDGQSFYCDASGAKQIAQAFESETINASLDSQWDLTGTHELQVDNVWENIFSPQLLADGKLALWSDENCEEVIKALCFGVQEYAKKSGFTQFTIALSGGMDSALVLTLLKLSLKPNQKIEAIYMPSVHSSSLSYDLAFELCQKLQIPMTTLPIKFLHSAVNNQFTQCFSQGLSGLSDENIQSRLRGALLYARSNQTGSMVVNTSNKSELAVGYSTQYGDSVGAISMLGDVYKSQVYRLAEYINQKYNGMIPEEIIKRPPSAELRPDQRDDQSLPPYDRLDAILEGILSYRLNTKDIIDLGHDSQEVSQVFNLYRKSEFKRYQFCPIIKVGSKSFGFGYRIPMSKQSQFYID
jgi:NAD+ synthase (glutamine-hydrolysing)